MLVFQVSEEKGEEKNSNSNKTLVSLLISVWKYSYIAAFNLQVLPPALKISEHLAVSSPTWYQPGLARDPVHHNVDEQ